MQTRRLHELSMGTIFAYNVICCPQIFTAAAAAQQSNCGPSLGHLLLYHTISNPFLFCYQLERKSSIPVSPPVPTTTGIHPIHPLIYNSVLAGRVLHRVPYIRCSSVKMSLFRLLSDGTILRTGTKTRSGSIKGNSRGR